MVAKNPHLERKPVHEPGPKTNPAFDGDFKRDNHRRRRKPSEESSLSSDSAGSEQEKL